eukprot:3806727-Prymnesium_polylepis.1
MWLETRCEKVNSRGSGAVDLPASATWCFSISTVSVIISSGSATAAARRRWCISSSPPSSPLRTTLGASISGESTVPHRWTGSGEPSRRD